MRGSTSLAWLLTASCGCGAIFGVDFSDVPIADSGGGREGGDATANRDADDVGAPDADAGSPPDASPTAITAGGYITAVGFACVVIAGAPECWGVNLDGQLGNGDAPNESNVPGPIHGLPRARAIAAGTGHTCAIDMAGGALCWGENDDGQLGDGSFVGSDYPQQVQGLTSGVTSIQVGGDTCALVNGGVKCWGDNTYGQLGRAPVASSAVPVDVAIPGKVVAVSVGATHECAVTTTNVSCWGRNDFGQLGNGPASDASITFTPAPVAGLPSTSFASVSAGYSHTCAVTSAGAVYCWGDNGSGQLGPGATEATSATPALVQGFGDDAGGVIAVVAAGALSILGVRTGHSCALLRNGHVWCWGSNVYGELGDGMAASSSTPVESGVTDAVAIAAASNFTCAMLGTGHVSCWGANASGELGNDSTVQSRSPVLVFGL